MNFIKLNLSSYLLLHFISSIMAGFIYYGDDGNIQQGACRTEQEGNGQKNIDYKLYDNAYDRNDCEDACDHDPKCYGYEWGKIDKNDYKCEHWLVYAPKYEAKSDYQCKMKQSYEYYDGYTGSVCRTIKFEKGYEGTDYEVLRYAKDLKDCMDFCTRDVGCYGWEWGDANKRCEHWQVNAPQHEEKSGHYCFMKDLDHSNSRD